LPHLLLILLFQWREALWIVGAIYFGKVNWWGGHLCTFHFFNFENAAARAERDAAKFRKLSSTLGSE
jgi:hypothetical protein